MAQRSPESYEKRRVDLTQGPILKRLVALAWPLFTGNILSTFYNLADMYWVSWVGTDAVAAVAVTFPTVWLTFSLGMGVTIAGTAFVAQYFGSGRREDAAHMAGQVLLSAALVATLLAALGIALRVPIARLMGAQGEVLNLAATYLWITFLGLPLRYIYFAYRSISQGAGDSRTPRNLLLFTVVLNVVLDPVLILGWFGLPAMGVAGAAWATLVADVTGAFLSLFYLANGRLSGMRVRLSHFKPHGMLLKRILRVGAPASLDMGARGLSSVVVAGIVSHFGAVEAASYGIVNRIMSITWTSSGAMEQAVASGVGQNVGAGKWARAERITWSGTCVIFAFLSVVGVLLFVYAEPIVRIFRVEENVITTSVRFLRLHVLSYGFLGARDVIQGGFRGAGRTFPPAAITFLSLWVTQIPLALLLSHTLGFGADGYWIVLFTTNIVFALAVAVWYRAEAVLRRREAK